MKRSQSCLQILLGGSVWGKSKVTKSASISMKQLLFLKM